MQPGCQADDAYSTCTAVLNACLPPLLLHPRTICFLSLASKRGQHLVTKCCSNLCRALVPALKRLLWNLPRRAGRWADELAGGWAGGQATGQAGVNDSSCFSCNVSTQRPLIHMQLRLQQASITPFNTRRPSSSLLLSLPTALSLFLSRLIASAPPYNHASSRLSFGGVYIAVIVRVQSRDWAEHVCSLTGRLCNKYGGGEDLGGAGLGLGGVVRTHKLSHNRTMEKAHK